MPTCICFWQLHSNGKDLYAHNQTRGLLYYIISPIPALVASTPSVNLVITSLSTARIWIEPSQHTGAQYYSNDERDGRFGQMQSISDEEGEEGVGYEKRREEEVCDMRRRCLYL